MAFVFDSTVGGANSNSFVSVSDGDDFFAAHLESDWWTALSTGKKQAALVQATNRIDRERFGGQMTQRFIQRLSFPRLYVVCRDYNISPTDSFAIDGIYYRNPNTIPREVKEATCEMALYYIKQAAGENTVDDNDLETLKNYKVGPLDLAIKDGIKADRLPTKVAELLLAIGPNGWLAGQPLRFTA